MAKKPTYVSSSNHESIKKRYLKAGKCKVTFRLSKEAAPDSSKVCIVGDFNNWKTDASPMKRLKSGDYKVELNLECGKEYRFKYLIDGVRWENHWNADRYAPNRYGNDDSVVFV